MEEIVIHTFKNAMNFYFIAQYKDTNKAFSYSEHKALITFSTFFKIRAKVLLGHSPYNINNRFLSTVRLSMSLHRQHTLLVITYSLIL